MVVRRIASDPHRGVLEHWIQCQMKITTHLWDQSICQLHLICPFVHFALIKRKTEQMRPSPFAQQEKMNNARVRKKTNLMDQSASCLTVYRRWLGVLSKTIHSKVIILSLYLSPWRWAEIMRDFSCVSTHSLSCYQKKWLRYFRQSEKVESLNPSISVRSTYYFLSVSSRNDGVVFCLMNNARLVECWWTNWNKALVLETFEDSLIKTKFVLFYWKPPTRLNGYQACATPF